MGRRPQYAVLSHRCHIPHALCADHSSNFTKLHQIPSWWVTQFVCIFISGICGLYFEACRCGIFDAGHHLCREHSSHTRELFPHWCSLPCMCGRAPQLVTGLFWIKRLRIMRVTSRLLFSEQVLIVNLSDLQACASCSVVH